LFELTQDAKGVEAFRSAAVERVNAACTTALRRFRFLRSLFPPRFLQRMIEALQISARSSLLVRAATPKNLHTVSAHGLVNSAATNPTRVNCRVRQKRASDYLLRQFARRGR
jgi:hypothetical protein